MLKRIGTIAAVLLSSPSLSLPILPILPFLPPRHISPDSLSSPLAFSLRLPQSPLTLLTLGVRGDLISFRFLLKRRKGRNTGIEVCVSESLEDVYSECPLRPLPLR